MEDKELFRRYRETGDIALRNEIVENYLYIASVIAKKFVGRGVEYDDLYQVAALALLKGVDRFDETKGLQFSTFITPTITGEIKNYFRDRSRLVHLPRRVSELRVNLKKVADEFMTETGLRPTAKELAERLGVSEEEVVRAAEAGGVVSLDKPVDDEDAMSFYEVIPTEEDNLERIENRDVLESAFSVLTKEERDLIEYRFVQEFSQTETAKRMNVSQMYVSRMERKVLNKLKERLKKSLVD
ncbi:MAG: sigma-70 family RNA polymerase sigma factor [Clostridia bacterium]|jgi:RNA polymerase sigma-B factor|nr:sigma-70 family RNA polymerase sigma factor [Clostridia bacterium]